MKEPEEFYEPEIETLSREAIGKLQLERLKWQVPISISGRYIPRQTIIDISRLTYLMCIY